MPYSTACVLLVLLAACTAGRETPGAATWPQTRPERTNYAETTRYDEAMAFLEAVVTRHPRLRLTSMGYTNEGRRLPLVVWGDVPAATPEAVHASGKTVVYVQGNIHAGEVEGKEAMLALVRELAQGQHADWARDLVLLINPIYNADGNERVALNNRPLQLGPIGGMGQRPNAQGLDLNRDMTKLTSPEARSLVNVINTYAPHVLIDLHTTNGSYHGYHLTYSPGLHPSTPTGITAFLRERLLPSVTATLRAEGIETHYYGNLNERPGVEGWTTFDHRARFVTNYGGLRGRVSILSEAYSYDPFDVRIRATKRFVEEILDYFQAHAAEVRALVATAPMAEVALRADLGPPVQTTILLDDVTEVPHPVTGAPMLRRAGRPRAVEMPERGTFVATETSRARGYLVPDTLRAALRLLTAHGLRSRGPLQGTVAAERFRLDSVRVAPRPFQNVQERILFGRWEPAQTGPAAYQVFCAHDAGPILGVLLEPRSDDGLAAWAVLGAALDRARTYPVLRSDAACES
ncbi:MAG TPA: M14 family metallopeptidase [Rhodothermales bacterium]|nr:M14 family metallopeptidase [Rhodothermales bacterium]